jgi:hypothetical protein
MSSPHSTAFAARNGLSIRGFPWLLFCATWLLLLGLHHHLTPHWHDKVYWMSVSDVADVARSGDSVHQLLTGVLGGIGAFLLFRHGRRLQVNGLVGVLFAAYIGWIGLTAIWLRAQS